MSYIVSIKRAISKSDFLKAIEDDEQFSIVSEGDDHMDLARVSGEERAEFNLSQGEITVTTPSDAAWQEMNRLSKKLGLAVVIGEEADLPNHSQMGTGVFENRETWIGWQILVVVLSALLIWKW